MKTKIRSLLALTIIFAMSSCGSDGTTTTIPLGQTGLTGFYVVTSTPSQGQFYVSETLNVITIKMSEIVDPATATDTNIQLLKNAPGDGTGEVIPAVPTVTPGSDMITLSGFTLETEVDYEIRIFPGLAATSGDTLLQGHQPPVQYFYINFSTSSGIMGGTSLPGDPYVVSAVDAGTTPTSCQVVMVTFNESLAYTPLMQMKYWDLANIYVNAIVTPISADSTRYYAFFPGTNCGLWSIKVKINGNDYSDLSGNHGTDYESNGFSAWW